MLTKRLAIRTIFMGVLGKMAHANEPPKADDLPAAKELVGVSRLWTVSLVDLNKPTSWHVCLDTMKDLRVRHGGEEIVITPEELFAALKS